LLGSSRPAAVKRILPDSPFKVIQARNADKALDLYSDLFADLFASSFGGDCPLGGRVNLCPVALNVDQEWVVGHRPAFLDQRLFDHSSHSIARPRRPVIRYPHPRQSSGGFVRSSLRSHDMLKPNRREDWVFAAGSARPLPTVRGRHRR